MNRSGDERGERLRARLENDQSLVPKLSVWLFQQWWCWAIPSGALAFSALTDLTDHPTSDVKSDALISLALSGLLLAAAVVAFVNRRKGTAAKPGQETPPE